MVSAVHWSRFHGLFHARNYRARIQKLRHIPRFYDSWICVHSRDYSAVFFRQRAQNARHRKQGLPLLKKIYSALEPDYNPTVIFYVDKYVIEFYDEVTKTDYRKECKNIDLVFLDLGKFKNISEWKEKDIEQEIAHIDENLFITKWKKANGLE